MGSDTGNTTKTTCSKVVLAYLGRTGTSPKITEEICLIDDGRLKIVLTTLRCDAGNITEGACSQIVFTDHARIGGSPKITEEIC